METKGIIYGRNPVREYLRAGKGATYLQVGDSARGGPLDEIIEEAKSLGVKVSVVPMKTLDDLLPGIRHQGVVLQMGRVLEEGEKEIVERVAREKGVLVLLDQITDPHNVGAIIRTAEALGADGVLMPRAHTPGITPVVVKSSAGATAHIPVVTVANAARFLDTARDKGFWVAGSDGSGKMSPEELKEIRPLILVIGSEGEGMRRLTTEKCDYITRIPLRGKVGSLNASVAAGILLYEILKK